MLKIKNSMAGQEIEGTPKKIKIILDNANIKSSKGYFSNYGKIYTAWDSNGKVNAILDYNIDNKKWVLRK